MYNASRKVLDVPGGNPAVGTLLWQWDKNDTDAQHFSFEDAGDGLVYIRTHCGNLYLTVAVPPPVVTTGGAPALAQAFGIKQDVKYKAGGIVSVNNQQILPCKNGS